jgi:hypothetical protein
VYCVLPAVTAPDATDAPRGLEGAPVRMVSDGALAALVSDVDAAAYTPEAITARAGDAAWLTPRAVAHDTVVTWASDRGAVIPLPMWVLFDDDPRLCAMLAERGDELRAALDRVAGAREYGVRVSADAAALATAADALDPTLAALARDAAAASPGQAYLLRRKLDEARRAARRDVAERLAREIHESLAARARATVPRVATQATPQPDVLLNAAYLVADDALDAFRAALTALVERHRAAGVRFDFTGPWPAYNFVRADG